MLFGRALDMVPAMAAARPGRRARALLSAHAALDWAAAGDVARASAMLARCYDALGAAGQPGALDALFDDSYLGAVGINSILVELENRRDPRPLAVLASLLVNFKSGQLVKLTQVINLERAGLDRGLAPHERTLAERIGSEAVRLMAGAGPHRSPNALAASEQDATSTWAALVIP